MRVGVVLGRGHVGLIGEVDHVAYAQCAPFEFLADAYEFLDRHGRARDGLVGLYLPALDALRDGDLLLARQKRHCSHLPQVDAHRVCALLVFARGEVEFVNLVERAFFLNVGSRQRRDLGDQLLVGLDRADGRRFQFLKNVVNVVLGDRVALHDLAVPLEKFLAARLQKTQALLLHLLAQILPPVPASPPPESVSYATLNTFVSPPQALAGSAPRRAPPPATKLLIRVKLDAHRKFLVVLATATGPRAPEGKPRRGRSSDAGVGAPAGSASAHRNRRNSIVYVQMPAAGGFLPFPSRILHI